MLRSTILDAGYSLSTERMRPAGDWPPFLGSTRSPRVNSSDGKERLGGISKMGDGYLRRLPVVGATAVIRMARQRGGTPWLMGLLERKAPKAAAVLANKMARIAWAMMARQESYVHAPA